jgi:iron complex transport system substrate-binding protein
MGTLTAADLAAAEAVHPDVIIGSAEEQEKLYEDLSRIAPTVMTDGGGGQWKLNVRLVGEGLGRTNDAEQVLTDYDREAAEARRTIAASVPGRPSVAVARVTGNGLRYAKRDSFAGTILADAGVKQVAGTGADVMLLSTAPGATAHLDGSFTRVDDELWWGAGGALAARAALADLQRALAPR